MIDGSVGCAVPRQRHSVLRGDEQSCTLQLLNLDHLNHKSNLPPALFQHRSFSE